ncbi:alpha/beta family hydrolase [Roseomonas sp. F4]
MPGHRGGALLADGRPLVPFLAEPGRLAFAVTLPVAQLSWVGAPPLSALRLLTSEAGTDLAVDGCGPALQSANGPAVLVAELSAPGAARGDCIMFLSGDSRPKDAHFGPLVRRSLVPFFEASFHTEGEQSGIPPDQALPRSFAERQEWLTGVLQGCADPGRLILMGRSSGARIASTLADLRPVRGLVCLGYPFRQPARPDDPSRYTHLPHLRTPTLIIQGSRDPYGGDDVPGRYPLAERTRLVMLDTDHGFRMEPQGWERVGREILLFLGHCCPNPG